MHMQVFLKYILSLRFLCPSLIHDYFLLVVQINPLFEMIEIRSNYYNTTLTQKTKTTKQNKVTI